MKFFVYIADAKVDALLAELSADERSRLAGELTLEATWLELAQAPRDAPDELRFARAEAVARSLELGGQAATLAQGKPYASDTRPLHWGRLRHVQGGELLRHESESPVWFGDLGGGLIMVGSASRLLAQPPVARTDHARDDLDRAPARYTATRSALDFDALDRRCLQHTFEPPSVAEPGAVLPDFEREPTAPEAWMLRLAVLPSELRALPLQRLEFCAKRLATFTGQGGETLVLAAPLFVAMAL